jgi:hypothetical protein
LEWSNRRWPTYIRSFYGYVEITEHQIGFRLTRWLYALCWTGDGQQSIAGLGPDAAESVIDRLVRAYLYFLSTFLALAVSLGRIDSQFIRGPHAADHLTPERRSRVKASQ